MSSTLKEWTEEVHLLLKKNPRDGLKRLAEDLLPLIGFFAATSLSYSVGPLTLTDAKLEHLFATAISSLAIAIGFIGTAKAILISIPKNRILDICEDKKRFKERLVGHFMNAVYSCFAMVAFSAILLLIPAGNIRDLVLFPIWIGGIVMSGLFCLIIVRIFGVILRNG